MPTWYAGIGGSDANSGATWPLRKLTITGLLGVVYNPGDRLLVGPGVYREQVTINGSGGNPYAVNTVSVTNESTTVTGAVTLFAANVAVGDQFFVGNWITGANGAYAAGQFTSAGANFQAGMVGYMIEVMTQGAYVIASVIDATTITLTDVNGVGVPGAGPYTYYVVSGEGPYEIETVDSNTQLTLVKPWSGPTLTGLSYTTYRPVYLIADTTGVETDGVGGVVRVTDTDDDETWAGRNLCFYANTRNYWIIRGFLATNSDSWHFYFDTCTYITVEDCTTIDAEDFSIEIYECTQMTLRRNIILGCAADNSGFGIYMWWGVGPTDNTQNLIENVYVDQYIPIEVVDCGSVTIKNFSNGFRSYDGIDVAQATTGAAVFVHDCLLHYCDDVALRANVLGEIVEQYCSLFQNQTDRFRVGTATNSVSYPYLPSLPLLGDSNRWPVVSFFAPSEWDLTRDLGGLYPKNEDLFGVHNEVAQTRRSWGAMNTYHTKRSTDQVQGTFTGSLYMEDAMEQQFVFPVRANWDYTVTVWVYLETNYAGNAPQMIVKQPGETSVTIASTLAIGSWEQLSAEFTTGAEMDWMNVSIVSRNTSGLVNRGAYWQDLAVN